MASRISVDTDTWWHLRAGQWILENRQVPRSDPFSYTRGGQPWEYPGWLVQVPLYLIFRISGPGGLNIWTAAMVTAAFAFLWHALSGGPFTRAFVIVLATATSGVYWAARPYMVTFVLVAAFIWILEDFRWRRADRIYVLPVLTLLWANSHGGFIIGFLLWGVYFLFTVGDRKQPEPIKIDLRSKKMLIVGSLMILGVAINPAGPVMLLYPFKTISIQALRAHIQEWQPPDFRSLQVQPFLWLIFATLGFVGFSGRKLALIDFVLFSGFAYLGFLAGRNIALFALIAPPILTRHAEPVLAGMKTRLGMSAQLQRPVGVSMTSRLINGILLVGLIAAVLAKVWQVYPEEVNWQYFREILPVEAVEFIGQENLPGRMFNTYNWGGYLMWSLRDYAVFIDGRTDLYNDELIEEWLRVVRAEAGWQEVLDRWMVQLVLVEPHLPLVEALEVDGWELLYADEVAVVYGMPP